MQTLNPETENYFSLLFCTYSYKVLPEHLCPGLKDIMENGGPNYLAPYTFEGFIRYSSYYQEFYFTTDDITYTSMKYAYDVCPIDKFPGVTFLQTHEKLTLKLLESKDADVVIKAEHDKERIFKLKKNLYTLPMLFMYTMDRIQDVLCEYKYLNFDDSIVIALADQDLMDKLKQIKTQLGKFNFYE